MLEAIHNAAKIVICPSNPVTSIGPILAMPGVSDALRRDCSRRGRVSPMIGESAISGPAHKLMGEGYGPVNTWRGQGYADFLDCFVIDREDEKLRGKIEYWAIKSKRRRLS